MKKLRLFAMILGLSMSLWSCGDKESSSTSEPVSEPTTEKVVTEVTTAEEVTTEAVTEPELPVCISNDSAFIFHPQEGSPFVQDRDYIGYDKVSFVLRYSRTEEKQDAEIIAMDYTDTDMDIDEFSDTMLAIFYEKDAADKLVIDDLEFNGHKAKSIKGDSKANFKSFFILEGSEGCFIVFMIYPEENADMSSFESDLAEFLGTVEYVDPKGDYKTMRSADDMFTYLLYSHNHLFETRYDDYITLSLDSPNGKQAIVMRSVKWSNLDADKMEKELRSTYSIGDDVETKYGEINDIPTMCFLDMPANITNKYKDIILLYGGSSCLIIETTHLVSKDIVDTAINEILKDIKYNGFEKDEYISSEKDKIKSEI
ncbi:MAG: hypothetical protein IJM38_03530 [Ruminococcus sp.]|nr:hypothetical protein [Ruminococcus sp.]